MGALVVVDMQRKFEAARDPLLRARVARRVAAFARRGDPVVVLEYNRWGSESRRDCETFPDVTRPLVARRWSNATTAEKYCDDGSTEVLESLRYLKFPSPAAITVIGVNRGACVLDTAIGLAQRLDTATVLVDWSATGCNCGGERMCASPEEYARYLAARRPNARLLAALRRSRGR